MTRPFRSGTTARVASILCALTLLIAACGDEDGDGDAGPAPASGEDTADGTTATPSESEAEPEESTEADQETSGSSPDAGESTAVLTVGDETFMFAVVDDGGSCTPDFLGGHRAILTRVDENGEPVEIPDLEGFTEVVDIVVSEDGEIEGVIGGNFGGTAWSAGEDGNEESSIDSVSIDGVRAEGTATFVNEEGDIAEGTFEVTCAEEPVAATGEAGDFCDDIAASIALDEDLSLTDPNLQLLLAEAISEMDAFRSLAPGDIAADVATLHEALIRMDDLLSRYGYDMTAVPEDELQEVGDAEVQEADRRLAEYCGY